VSGVEIFYAGWDIAIGSIDECQAELDSLMQMDARNEEWKLDIYFESWNSQSSCMTVAFG
jgi:hypothetical protein